MNDVIIASMMSEHRYSDIWGPFKSIDARNNVYNVFYGVCHEIGHGGFGVVYQADRFVAKPDGMKKDPVWPQCAIKVLNPPSVSDIQLSDYACKKKYEEIRGRILREMEFNQNERLHNTKHLVIPIRVHNVPNKPLIVMEYCRQGDLAKHVRAQQQVTGQCQLPPKVARVVVQHVVQGLQELKREGFFHRDIKPANIFLCGNGDENTIFKIGDFGLVAKLCEENSMLCGTPSSLAPEINGRNKYGAEVDVWSLGVLLFTILTGQAPFRGDTDVDTMKRAREQLHQFPPQCDVPGPAKDLINRLLQKDPRRRIALDDILCHPFIKDSSWPTNSTMFSDSGFSSSNVSSSLGANSPNLRPTLTEPFRPGKLQAVMETDIERFNRANQLSFAKNHINKTEGPVVASWHLNAQPMMTAATKPLISHSSFEEQLKPVMFRCASSAPSLATNLSSASIPSGEKNGTLLQPRLSTARLQPSSKRHQLTKASGQILDNGDVQLEFILNARNSTKGSTETMVISGNGQDIRVQRQNCPGFGVRHWQYDELPAKYWSKYNYAARFVQIVKESTPKITVYTDTAVCKLMENGPPEGNFEVLFFKSGNKYMYNAAKGEAKLLSCGTHGTSPASTSTLEHPDHPLHSEYRAFKLWHDRARQIERFHDELDRQEQQRQPPDLQSKVYPLTMGKRPTSLSSLSRAPL